MRLVPGFGSIDDAADGLLPGFGVVRAPAAGGAVNLAGTGAAVASGTATIEGGTADVNLAASGAAIAGGSATISSSGGTVSIAIPPLREFSTGVDRSAETGATVFVNAVASNSLIATITGVSFGVSGASVTHASLVAATAYRVTVVLSDGTEGTGILTAAAS